MIVSSSLEEVYQWTRQQRESGRSVGLVPTMGALHNGHLSLVGYSNERCQRTATTIFVNPTQFGPSEDLDRYPRTLDQDLAMLKSAGVDLVFTPQPEAIYPRGFSTFVLPPEVAQPLEGRARPDHFRGVTTIVLKLFQILPATHAFFGEKDYQQLAVIEAMVRDLNVPVEVVPCPIIREPDGLAMSSRNRYLSPEERHRSLGIRRALTAAEQQLCEGQVDVEQLQMTMRSTLLDAKIDAIEYAVVVDAVNLQPLAVVDRPAVALIAVRVGTTRLIDNQRLHVPASHK
ncbi:MAG: pantoate--beta-alanine ligase [Pirellulaceae bacterium]